MVVGIPRGSILRSRGIESVLGASSCDQIVPAFPLIPSRNRITIWLSQRSVQGSNLRAGGSNPSRRASTYAIACEACGSTCGDRTALTTAPGLQ